MLVLAALLKATFWFCLATVLALIEIESEGKYGWAENAPTWYRTRGLAAKLYGLVMGGKPLTGYHTFVFFLPLLIVHSQFFMGTTWSVSAEMMAWAVYFSTCPLWDYGWFVLNPHYAGKFSPEHVWWHAGSRWVFGLFPADYLIGLTVSIVLAGAASLVSGSGTPILSHLVMLSGFGAWLVALHLFAPTYRAWYARMRLTDDRDQAGIFHD